MTFMTFLRACPPFEVKCVLIGAGKTTPWFTYLLRSPRVRCQNSLSSAESSVVSQAYLLSTCAFPSTGLLSCLARKISRQSHKSFFFLVDEIDRWQNLSEFSVWMPEFWKVFVTRWLFLGLTKNSDFEKRKDVRVLDPKQKSIQVALLCLHFVWGHFRPNFFLLTVHLLMKGSGKEWLLPQFKPSANEPTHRPSISRCKTMRQRIASSSSTGCSHHQNHNGLISQEKTTRMTNLQSTPCRLFFLPFIWPSSRIPWY